MTLLFFSSLKNLIKSRSETSPRYNLVTTLILVVLISIKGYQCDGSGEASHVSTYKSTIRILPSEDKSSVAVAPKYDGKVKENQLSSSLPSKFTHPVILSPYR